ncbi:RNA 2',3'-cyclic phosphodiesterase [Pukyongiella litopenaei]|uniref:RNA 2',3'-cyclic phosphodiesterase n=1 Tax=Pukyongiella litopenaei TaxID=2605946 RepID=A0A2S0MTF9_9RHOB|nr:RNA 2',3'-cyclic phosphodiesterase [Pukyongiella litopenaei]AVO39011.1 RNA 2',3'-cyclic phosphodiesterase [Pukyongiella litopenaei]
MRAFVAIPVPDAVAASLAALQARLPGGRRVPRENLHLTLAFLDDQPEPALEELHGELGDLGAAAFDLTLAGLGVFGGDRPRLLYADIAPNTALSDLHRAVMGAARRAGMQLPRRRFHPHVTLARFGAGDAAGLGGFIAAHGATPLPGFRATGFGLYRSILRPDGAVHDMLAGYNLG